MKPERAHVLFLIAACASVLAAATRADQGSDGVRRLDELWTARDGDASQREAIDYGLALMASEPDNFEVAWRMARLTRWAALHQEDDDEKRRYATKAMQWAQRAITLHPDRVEGYFYQMMAVGEYGSTLSVPRAMYEGIGGQFERAGLKAYEIDRNYEDGETVTALGRYYFVLPWPKRDLAKSRRFLEEGVRDHPQVLMNLLYLAELEHEAGNEDKARTLLERVLEPGGPSSAGTEHHGEARALARAHLEKWFPEKETLP